MKIIFIIYNIFEVKSGVSNKYIHFFDFLNKKDIDFIILTTFNQSIKKDISIYNYIEFKGVNVPFYEYLKIPYINLDDLKKIVNHNDIIIFHSEFYWLYSLLNEIKNSYINIKLIPNWHTNYDYYTNIYFNNSSLLFKIKNILYKNLENNFFSGLITTGEISKNTFLKYNSNIFNANEICLENFNKFKINKYNQKETINIIHTGRIALEKNLLLIIDILIKLEEIKMNNYVMHFIGCGPYVKNLKKYIMKQDMNVKYIISDKIKTLSTVYGFMTPFKDSNELIFKTKNKTEKRMRGARCDQASKKETIKTLNALLNTVSRNENCPSNEFDEAAVKAIGNIELCCYTELILRCYSDHRLLGNVWFIEPEYSHAILQHLK